MHRISKLFFSLVVFPSTGRNLSSAWAFSTTDIPSSSSSILVVSKPAACRSPIIRQPSRFRNPTLLRAQNGSAALSNENTVPGNATPDAKPSFDPSDPTVPTYRTLLIYISTTVLIWLSEPLLSLVDTTVVGLTQGSTSVTQLASMGPSTTFVDSLLYLTYFLAIATTNLISKQRALKDYRQLQQTTSHVLGVATCLGLLMTTISFLWGPRILTSMAGASRSPELIFYAVRYTWIRALAGVSSVVGMVAQSFCLANLDTKTPAKAVLAASGINLVGDLVLSRWGVQGAAMATAMSSFTSCFLLMRAVRRRVRDWRKRELRELSAFESTIEMANLNVTATEETTDALVSMVQTVPVAEADAHREVPLVSLPDRRSLTKLLTLSGPIFFVIMSKIACYNAMTLRCTDFGVVALASHSIMMRIFFFFSTFGDAVSQGAQSFLPPSLHPTPNQKSFRRIMRRLVLVAGVVGLVNSQVSMWLLHNLGQLLTKDANIISTMKAHAGWFGAACLLHPFILVFEGTVIAARDFTTLIGTYAATLGLHFSILRFFCGSFTEVWRAFFLFQSMRAANFALRVSHKQRQVKKEEEAAAAATLLPP